MRALLLPLFLALGCSTPPEPEPPPSGAPVTIPAKGTIRGGLTMVLDPATGRVFEGFFSSSGVPDVCPAETVAGCLVKTCSGPSTIVVPAPFDPGTIKITSPAVGSQDLTIKDGYGRLVSPGDIPDGEDVRFVSTGGGGGGPFDLTTKAPTRIGLGSFANCGFGTLALCTVSEKLPTLTWNNGVKGEYVTMTFSPADTTGYPRTLVSCSFPAEGGIGKAPEAVLAKVDRTIKLSLFVQVSRPSVVSGPSDRQMGVTPTRWLNGGRITLQLAP